MLQIRRTQFSDRVHICAKWRRRRLSTTETRRDLVKLFSAGESLSPVPGFDRGSCVPPDPRSNYAAGLILRVGPAAPFCCPGDTLWIGAIEHRGCGTVRTAIRATIWLDSVPKPVLRVSVSSWGANDPSSPRRELLAACLWQRGPRPGSINPSMRSWARQVEHGRPRPCSTQGVNLRIQGRRRARRARASIENDHSERSSRVAISRVDGPEGAQTQVPTPDTTTSPAPGEGRRRAPTH